MDEADISALVDCIAPELEAFFQVQQECESRNHRDSEGNLHPQHLLDRSISTRYCNDLMQCGNCKMVYDQRPPSDEIQEFDAMLQRRITI